MRETKPSIALILLAIFVVGGVGAPVLHKFEHVRAATHQHGDPAPYIVQSVGESHALLAKRLVEERTPPVDIQCQLCARLACSSPLEKESPVPPPSLESFSDQPYTQPSSRSVDHLSIRAPPIIV